MLVLTNSNHFIAILINAPILSDEQLITFTDYLAEFDLCAEEGFDQ
jgi:hypothetical protein